MSFYTVFDTETVVTSTTTANLMAASDPILIHSSALKHKAQSTVGSVATLWPTSTSSSTATNINPFGVDILTAPSAASSWLLSTATQIGQCVTIFFNSTSTSSAQGVTTASTANMTFASTETNNGTTITFNQIPRAYVELTAGPAVSGATGSASWIITGRSAAGVLCT